MPSKFTQTSLLRAVLLLHKTHPELPEVTWEIGVHPQFGVRAFTFGPTDDLPTLVAYAKVLGGDITQAHQYPDPVRGQQQTIVLRAVFADVPLEIRGATPVRVNAEQVAA